MANAIQYYTPNKEFQISSVPQLSSNSEYVWKGRTLTAWYDSEKEEIHKISSDREISVVFSQMTASLSGLWDLDKQPISVCILSNSNDVKSEGGIVCLTADTEDNTSKYYPLPQRAIESYSLSNNQISDFYYDSNISIQLSAKEDCIPTKFHIKYHFWNTKLQTKEYDIDPPTKLWLNTEEISYPILSIWLSAEFNKGILTYYSGKNQPNSTI